MTATSIPTHKGLRLEEIIECLTDTSNNMDSKLLNIFLYTYRNYCDPISIIELLHTRLCNLNDKRKSLESNPEENEGFTKAVISLLNSWLTFPFAFDFCEIPDFKSINCLLTKIQKWPKTISFIRDSQSFTDSFKRLEEKINKVLAAFSTVDENNPCQYREMAVDCQFEESVNAKNNFKDKRYNCSLFCIPADIIAKGLTYLDRKVLLNLKLQELLTYIRKKPSPSVKSIIEQYNTLYLVVISTVKDPSLAEKNFEDDPYSARNSPIFLENNEHPILANHKRSEQTFEAIEKWIQIVQILSNMRNFSSLMAIITALNNPENIEAMKQSPKLYSQYISIVKLNEPYINQNDMKSQSGVQSNNSGYVSKLKGKIKNLKVHQTEIPYLGTYLKTLTYIDDGFTDFLSPTVNVYNGSDEPVINLDKCRRQFDVLVQVRLCISAVNSNEIVPDELFLKWYSEAQKECRKDKISLSDSVLSIGSTRSDNSNDSATSSLSAKYQYQKSVESSSVNKSLDKLNDDPLRQRSQSTPSKIKNATLKTENNRCKVATVKLKEPKDIEMKLNNLYRSANYPNSKNQRPIKKPETISNGVLTGRARIPIMHIVRSSSSINKEIDGPSLENILYKKIQINENDHTSDFIERVFQKFGIPYLEPSNFEVVQVLEKSREIILTENANVFYALAEQSQYLIEVRPKKENNI